MAVKPMLAIYTRHRCSNYKTFTEYLASDGHAMDILSGTTQTQGSSGWDSCAIKPPGIPPAGTVVRPVTQILRKEIDVFKPILNNIPAGLVCLGEESVPWRMLRRKSKVRLLAILLMLLAACAEKDAWVSIDLVQCLGNAWELDWSQAHPDETYPVSENNRIAIFKAYFADLDLQMTTVEIGVIDDFAEAACDACSCLTGKRYYASVDEGDIEALIGLGFTEASGPP